VRTQRRNYLPQRHRGHGVTEKSKEEIIITNGKDGRSKAGRLTYLHREHGVQKRNGKLEMVPNFRILDFSVTPCPL
jgi:hypothetical protein